MSGDWSSDVCSSDLSAFVAVFLMKFFSPLFSVELLCALSVSLSIMVMHFSRTMHPPGGATALIYIMGNEHIHSLGWLYPFTPIGLGAVIMLFVALLVNNLSSNSQRHDQNSFPLSLVNFNGW